MIKRIDRIISEQTNYSRKEIKNLVSKKLVLVNDKVIDKSDLKYDEDNIVIKINNEVIGVKKNIYLILNKPKGYVSTTERVNEKSVLELVPEEYRKRNLFPAGRLDKDTTGLMIITDDGVFAHDILSPKKHVSKTYEVIIDIPLTTDMVEGFKNGVRLNDGDCKSAILKIKDKYLAEVILTEGRYHQIKRMFGCYKAKVVELNRIGIGRLLLPDDLKLGMIRELSKEELDSIKRRD